MKISSSLNRGKSKKMRSGHGSIVYAATKCTAETLERRLLLTAISSGQTIAGNITTAGQKDSYTLSANAGDTFEVSVGDATSTSGYHPYFQLNGPSGSIVSPSGGGNSDTSVNTEYTVPANGAGTYTVQVSDYYSGDTGAYDIEMYKIPGTTVPDSNGDGGAIVSGQTIAGAINRPGDLDAFTISANAGDTFEISVGDATSASGYHPAFQLLDPAGNSIKYSNQGGNNGTSANYEYSVPSSGAGTYTILVADYYGSGTGAYDIEMYKIRGTPVTDSNGDGGPIVSGQTIAGAINRPGDLDEFTISANAGDTFEVSVGDANSASTYHPAFQLLDPHGNSIKYSNEGGNSDTSCNYEYTTPSNDAGDYTVLVSDYYASGTGTYDIEMYKVPGATVADSNGDGGPIVSGQTIAGSISRPGDLDAFTLSANFGDTFEVSVGDGSSASTYHPYFQLLSPAGILIASPSQGGNSDTSCNYEYTVPSNGAGTYTVLVSDYYGSGTGAYDIEMYKIPATNVADADGDGGTITSGQTRTGTINRPGDLDAFTLAANFGDTFEVSVGDSTPSSTYHPYFQLFSPSGARIANPSGGGNNDTSVSTQFTVPSNGAGTYTVLVSDYYGSGTGTYQVEMIKAPSVGPISPTTLQLNTPALGRINTSGEQDSWTFYGRAGAYASVLLNPGSSTASNFLPPFASVLGYGSVSLIAPDGVTVLGTQNATTSGQALTLAAIQLPTTGMYTIKVAATSAHNTSTGNYIVGAYDATPSIQSLDYNQNVVGSVASAFAFQQYTFAATANTQVQFKLAAGSSSAVSYTLSGPNGYIGFSAANASSALLTLPTTGNYTITAQGVGGQIGKYGFTLVKTSQTAMALGTPYSGTSAGSNQAQLFAIPITSFNPINIALADPNSSDHNELYASFGTPPTRQAYAYGESGAGANQSLLIPSGTPGTLYVLVYNESLATAPGSFTLSVTSSAAILTSAAPATGATNAPTTLTIKGAGFNSGSVVSLVSSGGTVYPATTSSVDLNTQITATFAAGSVPAGTFSIQVAQSGSTSQLSNVFTMSASGTGTLTTNLEIPNPVGNHIASTFYVDYSNTGTVAIPAPLLILSGSRPNPNGAGTVSGAFLTLDPTLVTSGFWTSATPQGYSSSIEILAGGNTPGVLQPGESFRVPVYYAGWLQSQWNFNNPTINFSLSAVQPGDTTAVNWTSTLAGLQPATIGNTAWSAISANLLTKLGTTAGSYVQMLDNSATYLGRLGENVTNVQSLWSFELQQADSGVSAVGPVLTSNTDDSLTAPGIPITFARSMSNTITGRDTLGLLGYGWSTPWETHATIGSDGTITIVGSGGSQEVFQPDSRHIGVYFSSTGDHNVLTADGSGGYLLTAPDGSLTDFSSSGKLNYVQDTNGNRITAAYTSGKLTGLTHSSGQSLSIAYNGSGLISSITDSAGRTTTYTYNSSLQLTGVQDYGGLTTNYTYAATSGASDNALSVIISPGGVHSYFTYDTQGRLSGTYADGNADATSFSYNEGSVTTTDALNDASTEYFDNNGELAKSVDALGNASYATYDQNFNLIKTTGPTGVAQFYSYDSNGNVISSTDALGNITQFTYGPDSELTQLTDAKGNKTSYGYDSAGDLLSTTYADSTTSSTTFNPLGEPISFVNQKGQAITYAYNTAGQLMQEGFSDGSSYAYTYDSHGNLLTAVDATGTTTFTYDTDDRMTKVTYPGGLYLAFTYNANGQRTQMVDQTGFTTNYQYDAAGRLGGLTDGSNNAIVTYTYDAAGRLSKKVNGNGTYTTYAYDADGNVLHLINYAPGGTTVNSRFDYTYDALGNASTEATIDGTWTYSYDADGELTQAIFTSTNSNIQSQNLVYKYDAAGNRTSTIINGTTTTYATNNMNEYTSIGGVTQTYDANGNLLSDGTNTYTYNFLSQLTGISGSSGSATYVYNALGQRASSTTSGITTGYIVDPSGLGDLVATAGPTGSILTHFTYGLGLVSQFAVGGSIAFYDFDLTGNTSGISSSAGSYTNRYVYLPFGQSLFLTGALPNNFTFAGQSGSKSNIAGNFDMRAREYNAQTGQFLSNDPAGEKGGDANIRRYVNNSPLSHIDRTGCEQDDVIETTGDEFEEVGDWLLQRALSESRSVVAAAARNAKADRAAYDLALGDFRDLSKFVAGVGKLTDGVGYLEDFFDALGGAQEYARGTTQGYVNGLTTAGQILFAVAFPEVYFSLEVLHQVGLVPSFDSAVKLIQSIVKSVTSHDPNAKIGPDGYGSSSYVADIGAFPYKIEFENASTATAPAQEVTITDQLSSNVIWNTFQLTQIGFGDTNLVMPAGTQSYDQLIPMTYAGFTFNVEVEAGINTALGQVYANFFSIDPTTQLPPAIIAGFLPPEDGSGRGEEYVSYTVKPKANLSTGTVIKNIASISFDGQPIITTDQVNDEDPTQGVDTTKEASVTIDSGAPTSTVLTLPAQQHSPSFNVTWSGQDDTGGSGVATYTIYVSTNGSAFTPWLVNTNTTSGTYAGAVGNTYSFYSVATDNVGNIQATPMAGEASTTITQGQVVTLSGSAFYIQLDADGQHMDVWNTTTANGSPTQSFLISGLSTVTVTGASGGTSVTVDFTNGDPFNASGLTFNGIAGTTDVLNVTGTSGNDTVTVNANTLIESAAFGSAILTYSNLSSINFSGGTGSDVFTQAAQPGGSTALAFVGTTLSDTLTVNAGTYTFAASTGSGVRQLSLNSLSIASGATVSLAKSNGHANRSVLVLNGLSLGGGLGAWTSTLDLGDNDLIVHGGIFANVIDQLTAGYNGAAGGNWNGMGVDSMVASTNSTHLTTIGLLLNNDGKGNLLYGSGTTLGLFDGVNAALNDVLVKYTYYGDANLDGKVDGSDYSKIDSGYLTHSTGLANGDFNYDGVIDGSDYTLIDNAFNTQGAILSAQIASPTAALAIHTALSVGKSGWKIATDNSEILSTKKQRPQLSSFASSAFSTGTAIAFAHSAEGSLELSMQKKDLLDGLRAEN